MRSHGHHRLPHRRLISMGFLVVDVEKRDIKHA